MTKAISLEPWQADMAYYANHDMVRRAVASGDKANPNPFQKEEHHSYYRVSFTIDLCRLGYQDIHMPKLPQQLKKWVKGLPSASNNDVKDIESVYGKVVDDATWYYVSEDAKEHGMLGVFEDKNSARVTFVVSLEQRQARIKQLLEVITNGLVIHSSTENYGAIPVFFVLGALRVPVPVFNSYVEFKDGAINARTLNYAINNDYVTNTWLYQGVMSLDGQLDPKARKWKGVEDVLNTIELRW